ncbi:uncharacterized protein LOC118199001 [Stegodyphus dumicola]|uniref:uncharacterized protein LOC118199001 n=1 Tax=Stegodyphus dumicola TaxID=202533 RepID=UPI0015AD87D7|nr:uncharacterized protein LOC118199001 [Stegodyphus dumicola]
MNCSRYLSTLLLVLFFAIALCTDENPELSLLGHSNILLSSAIAKHQLNEQEANLKPQLHGHFNITNNSVTIFNGMIEKGSNNSSIQNPGKDNENLFLYLNILICMIFIICFCCFPWFEEEENIIIHVTQNA